MKIRLERNTAAEFPPDQKWVGILVDANGDEWSWFFAGNYTLARRMAAITRQLIREGKIG